MRVLSINNSMNFQGRIKISKPQNLKTLATGTALIGAGTSSMVTGLDASNSTQGSNMTDELYKIINNAHEVATPNGNIEVNNESAASSFGTTVYASFPIGLLNTSIGVNKLSDNKSNKNNESIPS